MPKLSIFSPMSGGEGRATGVVSSVSDAIFLGILKPGERLPTETELARQFTVAPMTVREALSELRSRGMIETRRGRNGGSFVREVQDLHAESVSVALMKLTFSQLRDLADEQEAITTQSAGLAAQRASSENVRKLDLLIDELRCATTGSARARADSRFHVELAVSAYSERLTRAEAHLQAEVGGMLWLPTGAADFADQAVREHQAIRDAVAARDHMMARRAASAHIRGCMLHLGEMHISLGRES